MNRKKLTYLLLVAVLVLGFVAILLWGGEASRLILQTTGGGKYFPILLIVASLVDSINPCAFSVLLITVAFLLSIGSSRKKILQVGGTYILGIFTAYFLIGLGILRALTLFNVPHFMGKIGAALLIVIGISELISHFVPSFPIKFRLPHSIHGRMAVLIEKASFPAAFLLGGLVASFEFPCTGGPYLMILGLLNDQGQYWTGFGYLLLYNLIFISPLVVILVASSLPSILGRLQKWRDEKNENVHLWTGIVMILLAFLILMF